MTWSANFSGHTDDAVVEGRVLDVLERAAASIREILGPGDYGSYYSQHHGSGRLIAPPIEGGVSTQEEPAPGTGGATPGGVGLGSGNATGGGEGGGG
jgi:hypothetical protein